MDYNIYADLQKQYPRTICNDNMMPTDLRKRFEHGIIEVVADDRALFLFESREGFAKLHFRLIDASAKLKSRDGMVAAYLTYRDGNSPEAAAAWLLGQGFRKIKTLRRHTATIITGDLTTDGVGRASVDEAYAMLGEYFGAAEADLPCRELFEGALCIRSEVGVQIGAIYLGRPSILAVTPEARGNGVGRRLYRAYAAIKTSEDNKCLFHEWVSPDNTESLAMFKSLGFAADDVFTDCYVRS